MADVNGKPFLYHLLEYWEPYIDRFVMAVGYGQNHIRDYFFSEFRGREIIYDSCIDGTAAAVAAIMKVPTPAKETFVINGDTWFEIDPMEMLDFHRKQDAHMTLSYSSKVGIHAGVDILETRPRYHTRGAIFTHSGFFIDIGTPERLNAFREHKANQ